jgi:hypothetical protein
MPMHDAWTGRLSEYLDGELEAADRAALTAHLGECAECRADLDGLRAVTERARMLDDAPPAADLWAGVAARIDALPKRRTTFVTRQFAFTLPQLVAAGLALMLASGGMVWLARLGGSRTDFPVVMGDASQIRPANFGDAAYDDAVADLQRMLAEGRGRLDQETVRVLESNLRTIDQAIAECRDALAADPANVYLMTYLAETRARKLELLRRATALVDSRS